MNRRTFIKGVAGFIATALGVEYVPSSVMAEEPTPVKTAATEIIGGGFTDDYGHIFKFEPLARTRDAQDYFLSAYQKESFDHVQDHWEEYYGENLRAKWDEVNQRWTRPKENPFGFLYATETITGPMIYAGLVPNIEDHVNAQFEAFQRAFYATREELGGPLMNHDSHALETFNRWYSHFKSEQGIDVNKAPSVTDFEIKRPERPETGWV